MDNHEINPGRAYRKAGFGLAVVAVAWTLAFLLSGDQSEKEVIWLIPIGAAVLSVICFSLYAGYSGEKRK